MSGDAYELAPYRVEWRPDLSSNWQRLTGSDSHGDALEQMASNLERYGGQVRAVTQHVIEARGLGL